MKPLLLLSTFPLILLFHEILGDGNVRFYEDQGYKPSPGRVFFMVQGDEMFSDTYEIKLVDEVMYEVTGKWVERKSPEEADESIEAGVDIVLNHRLQETAFKENKAWMGYLKEYIKKVQNKLQATDPDQVEVFKTNMNKVMKDLLQKFNDFQFFTGESMDSEGMVAILEYRRDIGDDEDTVGVPILMFFKHGLEEEETS